MKPYYYVYRYQKNAPVVRHYSPMDAKKEAERIAALHPGEPIEILKAVAISQVSTIKTFFMDGELPF